MASKDLFASNINYSDWFYSINLDLYGKFNENQWVELNLFSVVQTAFKKKWGYKKYTIYHLKLILNVLYFDAHWDKDGK